MWRRTVWHKITHVLEKIPSSIFSADVEGNSFPLNVGKFLKDSLRHVQEESYHQENLKSRKAQTKLCSLR